jgi:FO synthase
VRLFAARGSEVEEICADADALRAQVNGDVVTYVVNRNINYTNVCSYACSFCAFSKGKLHDHLRGRPYDLALEEIARRTEEAWQRGATEVCLQGGIHPAYTGETYLTLLRTVKEAVPRMHVHAFSPLEISHGAQTLGVSLATYLERLQKNGLGSLPGTAAEILDDAVRARICPDKLNTREWLEVVGTAHVVGLRTTATIMFGHVEDTRAWAAHLLHLRDLQERTGGLTEFVPLPFVHMEAPMYLKTGARRGPTWRETMLMHAVARLVLNPLVTNIQASWVKAGPAGVARLLSAGVNDCGGTLMNESISRAAGTQHGQELPPEAMEAMIRAAGREPRQRTTLYRAVDPERQSRSFDALPLAPVVQTPVRRMTHRHAQAP